MSADENRLRRRRGGRIRGRRSPCRGAPGLALRDLRPQQARLVLALQRHEMAARIEHGDGERLQLQAAAMLQRLVDDDGRLGEA